MQGGLVAWSSRVREAMGYFGDKLWAEQDRIRSLSGGLSELSRTS